MSAALTPENQTFYSNQHDHLHNSEDQGKNRPIV
uniref:Uncharacterized protein n=1 Tax=Arundo donax TaxID=35708 RepID=A0A0A9CE11_ARUDO